jgi:quercetin dioxygenase-like cupin family protein
VTIAKITFDAARAEAVTAFGSAGASAIHLADGHGEGHTYVVRFDPGGFIGRHPAGFDQLFLVVEGQGWAEDGEGQRTKLATGEAALIRRGEVHAKGSETGLTAVMIQLSHWTVA